MEINVKEIFKRADIKQIRSFLLDGDGEFDDDCYGTYEERLNRNSEDIINTLRNIISKDGENVNELHDAMRELTVAFLTYRDVFSEIGMKVGARLLFQLLFDDA